MAALMGANKQLLPGITATDNPSEAFVVRTFFLLQIQSYFVPATVSTTVSCRSFLTGCVVTC